MDIMESKQVAWKLKRNEYLRLVDTASGQIRVERNDDTAVLVESKETGQQRLVHESGMFYPEPHDEILEVRKLIRVQPHEVVIVQSNTGKYTFHGGSCQGSGTAFFLPPHHELV